MINENKSAQFLDYCRDQLGLSDNTIRAYEQDLKVFRDFAYSSSEMGGNHQQQLLKYLRYLRSARSACLATIRRRFSTLRCFFKWQEQISRKAFSPFHRLRVELKKPTHLPRPIDRSTLQILFKAVHCEFDEVESFGSTHITNLMLRLLVVTGMRVGEITSLNIKSVFSSDIKIRVHGKGNRERVVHVSNDCLRSDFQKFITWRRQTDKPDAHLFPNLCGERLTPTVFRKRLRQISIDADICTHLTPHQFRHSAAKLLIDEGIDMRIVQKLLGHASIATTEIYTKVSDQTLLAAVEKAAILGLVQYDVDCQAHQFHLVTSIDQGKRFMKSIA